MVYSLFQKSREILTQILGKRFLTRIIQDANLLSLVSEIDTISWSILKMSSFRTASLYVEGQNRSKNVLRTKR